ncbi:S-adenosyl-L-methionine-dependent methyltransferase [Pseudoneurospora amorphoporcata]|uniref:S-adenosyl-L-methionine-dependent methyltransferase n=1 Tax=Pseudoneurospora amorphoporcata TaxID=241081 RepID=A0AAN6SBY3_9PEZI|nr:S-adenosyl-L-methionine-dependent methyltransferase [Pseudoneurospora amorphoporcata]
MVTSPKSPKSPKGNEAASAPAPAPLSTEAQNAAGILPASHWTAQSLPEEDPNNDTDSTIGSLASTTASLTSSIYKYRTIQGRTYHGEMGTAESWEPNDARHVEAMEILHHTLILVNDGKLFLAPLEKKKIHKVLDIATGSGLWSIDFADEFPAAEVIGTDVSPTQPTWVPPNVQFELEDCNQEWTWPENTFDFVNLRFLNGIVDDWYALFRNAYRVCKPGAWVESSGTSTKFLSPDGTVKEGSAMDQWGKVFQEGGKKLGRTFAVYEEDLQRKCMEAAGFVDIEIRDIEIPLGIWHPDKKAAERGLWWKMAVESDIEGYINYFWHAVLGWTPEEAKVFARHIKKEWNDPNIHGYFMMRVAWGRKPE